MKITKLITILFFLTPLYGTNIKYSLNYKDLRTENKIDTQIMELWTQAKTTFDSSVEMLKASPIELYFIASDSYNLINYAFKKKKFLLIDELLQIYMKTIPYIKKEHGYSIFHLNEKEEKSKVTLKESIYIWTNKENQEELISSAQFLFVISFSFEKITKIPKEQHSTIMKNFIQAFSPILSSHYRRWIIGVEEHNSMHKILGSFNRRGWGCKNKDEDYIYARTLNKLIGEVEQKSYHGASYCNVIADPILLIVSGLGYYIGGTYNQKDLYSIQEKEKLDTFLQKSIKVISKEFKVKKSMDFNKNAISTLSFQEGAWSGHPDYAYSGYTGKNFPHKKDLNPIKEVGLDVAHGDRVLYFLDMLIANKKNFSLSFPSELDMRMFSDGFLYNVFNGDIKYPLFKNYMNGSNGWFRVNYDSRDGYGYAPFSIGSTGAVLGGYPRLAQYNKKLENIFTILYKCFNSKSKKDYLFINKFYEKAIWTESIEQKIYHFKADNRDNKSALFLMNFYSSLL